MKGLRKLFRNQKGEFTAMAGLIAILIVAMTVVIISPMIAGIGNMGNKDNCIDLLEEKWGLWVLAGGSYCVPGDLNPCSDNNYDFGSATTSWQDGYFDGDLNANDTTLSGNLTTVGIEANDITSGGMNVGVLTATGNITTDELLAPTGRGATLVVAASDASDLSKAQADYVCDGTADNVEIQAAIDALTSGTVQLTEGIYTLAARIVMDSNINLMGMGYGTEVTGQTNLNTNLLYANSESNILISNIQFDGNKVNQAVAANTVVIASNCSYVTIKNCWVHNGKQDGVNFYEANSCTIDNVYVYSHDRYGIVVYYAATTSVDIKIDNCVVYNNTSAGVINTRGGNLLISNTISKDNGFAGFHSNDGFNVSYVNCLAHGNGAEGLDFYETEHSIMSGCIAYGNDTIGISVDTNSDYCIISGCSSYLNGEDGINIWNSKGCIVVGNQCYANSQVADNTHNNINVDNNSDRNLIQSNICRQGAAVNQPAYGINIDDAIAEYNIVKDNDIYDSGQSGNLRNIGVATIIEGNYSYITSGEIRTASGSLTAGNANAICFYWHNPEAQDILIKKVVIEVTTVGGTAGSHLDVGIADDAAGTNRGTEFFNDLLLNSVQINDSWVVGDGGTQTKWVFCQDSASATDGWIVGQILDANAASLVGKWYLEYVGR